MQHVGVNIGDGTVVHARGTADGVIRSKFSSDPWTHYRTILSGVVSELDATTGVYAELFDADLNNISERSQTYGEALFEAAEYPELMQAMGGNEQGESTVRFDKQGTPPHDIYIYFRWVPTDNTLHNRMLIVLGMSRYSVSNSISSWIVYGAAALIIIAAAFILAAEILLSRVGSISAQKEGSKKWRKTSS
jgi:hypothetical protein